MTPIRNVLSKQHYYYVHRSDEIEWNEKTPTMKTHKIFFFSRVSFLSNERRRRRRVSQIYNSRLVEHSQCVFFCLYVTILLCGMAAHCFKPSQPKQMCACIAHALRYGDHFSRFSLHYLN